MKNRLFVGSYETDVRVVVRPLLNAMSGTRTDAAQRRDNMFTIPVPGGVPVSVPMKDIPNVIVSILTKLKELLDRMLNNPTNGDVVQQNARHVFDMYVIALHIDKNLGNAAHHAVKKFEDVVRNRPALKEQTARYDAIMFAIRDGNARDFGAALRGQAIRSPTAAMAAAGHGGELRAVAKAPQVEIVMPGDVTMRVVWKALTNALRYYHDFGEPHKPELMKVYRMVTGTHKAIEALSLTLNNLADLDSKFSCASELRLTGVFGDFAKYYDGRDAGTRERHGDAALHIPLNREAVGKAQPSYHVVAMVVYLLLIQERVNSRCAEVAAVREACVVLFEVTATVHQSVPKLPNNVNEVMATTIAMSNGQYVPMMTVPKPTTPRGVRNGEFLSVANMVGDGPLSIAVDEDAPHATNLMTPGAYGAVGDHGRRAQARPAAQGTMWSDLTGPK